ncbi:MAG: hypothetical protein KW806_02565 [Candidatus Yanofskybacteria bacterium]|nr:hypothetical protein [Candidatus Yanofskybacteria bacterium]
MDPFSQMQSMMPGHQPETNLWSIILNAIFGFVLGLMFLVGVKEVIAYGTKLATDLFKLTGQGQQMGGFGFASAAPYIILAPLGGIVVKQLSSVRTLKSFAFFAIAVLVGFAVVYFAQGYFATLLA